MKTFFLEDFFISNIFYPFLLICLVLGILSFFLIILHYFVCRLDEIKDKEKSINDTFFLLKGLYKKRLIALEETINEIKQYKDLYGDYEEKILTTLQDERFKNKKKLEKVHHFGKEPNSMKNLIEIENIIENSVQQIISIGTKNPDLKTYSKYLNCFAKLKSLDDEIDTNKCLYNRKVKEFNQFIINFPYIFFAIVFKIAPRKTF